MLLFPLFPSVSFLPRVWWVVLTPSSRPCSEGFNLAIIVLIFFPLVFDYYLFIASCSCFSGAKLGLLSPTR